MRRAEGAERAERAEWAERFSPLYSAFSALSAFTALACARIEPPPGGPPDVTPPRLVAVRPQPLESLWPFRDVAEFQFDEVISEGGTPNRGEGTGGLERLVILSPTTRVPEVTWRRNRITVRPREGWQRNRVYRIQILPGITDLRNNRSDSGAVLTFTTGAPRPTNTLQGQILDWGTARPAPSSLVIATLLPDSLPYRGLADSTGRFSLGPLPNGEYLVTGVLDQNSNHLQDAREAYASARLPRGRSDVGELWAFVHDTTPPRIQTITVNDSASATVTLSQKLDPRQRLTPRDVRLRLLPDSLPVTVTSILPEPVDDSLHGHKAAIDTSAARDTIRLADTAAARRKAELAGRAVGPQRPPSRPPLFDRLVLRVPKPWAPGARLVLQIRGVKNVTGVPGDVVGVIAVPEKTAPATGDTLRAAGRRDSTKAKGVPRQPQPQPKK